MAIRFSPEMKRIFNQMSDTQRNITKGHMADDLGRAYELVGALIAVKGIAIDFNENGLVEGTESDMDFAVSVCYEKLRVQRAICSKFEAPDHDMLEQEKHESGS